MATTIGDLQNLVNQQGDQVQNVVGQQNAAYQAMLDRQNTQQQGLFDQYSQTIGNQKPLTQVYGDLQSQFGLPDAMKSFQGYKDQTYRVQGLLNNLVGNINNRTNGTLTTQAMRDRMAASEGGDLNTQLQSLGLAMQPYADVINTGNQQIATLLPLTAQDYQRQLQPLELQINSLSDRYAREISGFNTNQQSTLSALMDKLDKQWTLSEKDWEMAQQAAAQASQYNNYLKSQSQALPQMQQRANGGYNFQDESGNPISALSYSNMTGLDFTSLLKKMASHGDTGAKTYLSAQGGAPLNNSFLQAFTWGA